MKWFKRKDYQIPLLTNSFWWAVNDVKNYVMFREGKNYEAIPPEERRGHVFESARILHLCIEEAYLNGCINLVNPFEE